MPPFVRRLFNFFLFIALFGGAHLFCKKQTDGFQLFKIRSDLSFHPEWAVAHSEEETRLAKQVLSQPYTYLAKGAQSYVFISQDGKYVLKFFRQHHLRPSIFVRWLLPFSTFRDKFQAKVERKQKEMQTDFTSYKIAFEHLKEETGLLYVHLNKGQELKTTTRLIDKLGIEHPLDMDKMEFLVQKKAFLLYEEIDRMIEQNKIDELKVIFKELIALIEKRCKLGIFDKDPDLNTNFGLIDGKPVQIDVGRYRYSEKEKDPAIYTKELIRITDDLRNQMRQKCPELSLYLESLMMEKS